MSATLEHPQVPAVDLDNPEVMEKVKQRFVQVALPRITEHAQIQFRGIRDPGRHDDAIANTVGIGWRHWLSAIRRGKNPEEFISRIADYAVRQTRSGRRVDRQERPHDALSPRAQRDHGFVIERLSPTTAREVINGDPHGQERADAIEERLADNVVSPIPDQVAFKERFGMMLDGLNNDRHRAIVEDLAMGESTKDVAEKHKVTPAVPSQVRRKAENWWRERERKDNAEPERGR